VSVIDLISEPADHEGEPVTGINPKIRREQGEKIAVLSSVGAGIPLEAINTFDQDDPDSWEEISKLEAAKGPHYALRIRGNSMSPRIRHGDVVIVQLTDHYEDGDTVIALVNGSEGVCKVLEFRDDGIALKSTNPDYPPMIFTREQIENLPVRLMGKCVELRGKL
jgi:repressor LexA